MQYFALILALSIKKLNFILALEIYISVNYISNLIYNKSVFFNIYSLVHYDNRIVCL